MIASEINVIGGAHQNGLIPKPNIPNAKAARRGYIKTSAQAPFWGWITMSVESGLIERKFPLTFEFTGLARLYAQGPVE
jgi:hypothetical protein